LANRILAKVINAHQYGKLSAETYKITYSWVEKKKKATAFTIMRIKSIRRIKAIQEFD